MNKKILIFATLIFSFFINLYSAPINAKFGIGLKGAYSLIDPADFNDDFVNVIYYGYKSGASDPTKLKTLLGSTISALGQGSLDIKYFLFDNFALYLRSDYLITEYDDVLTIDNKDVLESHFALNTMYFGLGARYYIGFEGIKLYPYVSVDGGAFMHLQSYWEVTAKNNSAFYVTPTGTNQTANQAVDFTDLGFGGNAEIGLEFLFTDTIGIGIGAGYRYAPMPFAYPATGIFKNKDSKGNLIFNATTLDLSGPYFGGGFGLYFGGADKSKVTTQTSAVKTGTPQQYEKYGDYYYSKKNYQFALRYYAAAEKQNPSPELYKKMGLCYYYLNNKPKAIEYLDKYLEQNPSDTKTKNWVDKLR